MAALAYDEVLYVWCCWNCRWLPGLRARASNDIPYVVCSGISGDGAVAGDNCEGHDSVLQQGGVILLDGTGMKTSRLAGLCFLAGYVCEQSDVGGDGIPDDFRGQSTCAAFIPQPAIALIVNGGSVLETSVGIVYDAYNCQGRRGSGMRRC